MVVSDRQEYHSVILGALLHDIGKLLHRGKGGYEGTHENASATFIDNFREKLKNDKLYDIDLIKLFVKHHGSTKSAMINDEYLSSKTVSEKDRVWKLLKIVKYADSYSGCCTQASPAISANVAGNTRMISSKVLRGNMGCTCWFTTSCIVT